jgi:hypothetical protein
MSWDASGSHYAFYTASNTAITYDLKSEAVLGVKKLLEQYNLPKGWKVFLRSPQGSYYPMAEYTSSGVQKMYTQRFGPYSTAKKNPRFIRTGEYFIVKKDNEKVLHRAGRGEYVLGKYPTAKAVKYKNLRDAKKFLDNYTDGWRIFEVRERSDLAHDNQPKDTSKPQRRIVRSIKFTTKKNPCGSRKKNPETSPSADAIANRTARRRAEGKAAADARKDYLKRMMTPVDRFQPSWAYRNMIKALEIATWMNSVEDWQRYYEAKYIMSLRRARRKK